MCDFPYAACSDDVEPKRPICRYPADKCVCGRHMDLELIVTKHEDGFNYEWQDQHGAVRCCGWFRGTESQVCVEAIAHLEGPHEYTQHRKGAV